MPVLFRGRLWVSCKAEERLPSLTRLFKRFRSLWIMPSLPFWLKCLEMGNEMRESSRITVGPPATPVTSTTRSVSEAIRSITGVGREAVTRRWATANIVLIKAEQCAENSPELSSLRNYSFLECKTEHQEESSGFREGEFAPLGIFLDPRPQGDGY